MFAKSHSYSQGTGCPVGDKASACSMFIKTTQAVKRYFVSVRSLSIGVLWAVLRHEKLYDPRETSTLHVA